MGSHSVELFQALRNDLERAYGQRTLQAFEACDVPIDLTPKEYAGALLFRNILKKYQGNLEEEADNRALQKFLDANERCRTFSIWCESWEDELLGTFKDVLYQFYVSLDNSGLLSYNEILSRGRMGPGSSIGSRGTDGYSKLFASPLTYTSESLLRAYKLVGCPTPRWQDAEALRAFRSGDGRVVDASRLSFVPKTSEISRTICTEPSLNMYYQLGFGSVLEAGLRHFFGIDLSCQPDHNALMAWSGSLTGQYCTIDLESASDSVSMNLLEWCLPRQLLAIIKTLRTPKVQLPDGSVRELGMVSTMGNGFTFPLQTLIFAAAVRAVYLETGLATLPTRETGLPGSQEGLRPEFGVFGDDIVIDRRAYRKVVLLLQRLGFRVNSHKSFSEGSFRESCGHDYFRGHNVRAVYLKTLATKQDRYSAFNRLADWSARWVRLDDTLAYLLRTVPLNEVPIWEAATSGIQVPMAALSKKRYNRNGTLTFYRFEPHPRNITFLETGVVQPPRYHKSLYSNPNGAELLAILGAVRNHKISVRHDRIRWRRRKVVAPDWDNYRSTSRFAGESGWLCWTSTVSAVMARSTGNA